MDDHAIHGTLADLRRLAALVEEKAKALAPGESCRIREEYARNSKFTLVLSMHVDDFDPASLDAGIQPER